MLDLDQEKAGLIYKLITGTNKIFCVDTSIEFCLWKDDNTIDRKNNLYLTNKNNYVLQTCDLNDECIIMDESYKYYLITKQKAYEILREHEYYQFLENVEEV